MTAAEGSHAIQFGRTEIRFALTYTSRHRLKITVRPDMGVTVEAPAGKEWAEIEQRVRRRAPWIVRQLEYFRRFQPLPTPRRYIGGETHLYLGRQYRLKVVPAEAEGVKLHGGFFQVSVGDTADTAAVERLMKRWYNEHGRAILLERLRRRCAGLEKFGIPQPTAVRTRAMRRRWGSCGKTGMVMLNTALAQAPLPCMDYVITHELCHLVYPNHSPTFWRLLDRCMPDWRHWKERLEQTLVP